MNAKVLFFGSLTDLFGRERAVDLPAAGVSVSVLCDLIALSAAEAQALAAPGIRAAVDQEVAAPDALVRPGQEVAFFSPVSGG